MRVIRPGTNAADIQSIGIGIAGVVYLEQSRIGTLAGVEIVHRDRGVEALGVGYRPLLELHILGAEHDHQPASADNSALFLSNYRDEYIVGIDRYQMRILREIDAIGEQESQGCLRQRVDILGCQPAVAHHHRRAVRYQLDGTRVVVLKSDSAWLGDVEISLGSAAIGADLDEISGQRLHARKIVVHAVDDATLFRG